MLCIISDGAVVKWSRLAEKERIYLYIREETGEGPFKESAERRDVRRARGLLWSGVWGLKCARGQEHNTHTKGVVVEGGHTTPHRASERLLMLYDRLNVR